MWGCAVAGGVEHREADNRRGALVVRAPSAADSGRSGSNPDRTLALPGPQTRPERRGSAFLRVQGGQRGIHCVRGCQDGHFLDGTVAPPPVRRPDNGRWGVVPVCRQTRHNGRAACSPAHSPRSELTRGCHWMIACRVPGVCLSCSSSRPVRKPYEIGSERRGASRSWLLNRCSGSGPSWVR